MDKEEIIKKAFELIEQMKELDEEIDGYLNKNELKMVYTLERHDDELYNEYWHLIYDNFNKEDIEEVENKIGIGHFNEEIFIEELRNILERTRVLDEYEGYVLKLCKDCMGNEFCFVFKDDMQYSEELFYIDDETSKEYFRKAIDEELYSPKFDY